MTWDQFKNGLTEIEKPLVEAYRDILSELDPKSVLEVGSGWGLFSRSVMEWTRARLTTVDKTPFVNLKDMTDRVAGFETRIEFVTGNSLDVLPKLVGSDRKFDLVFVDGDHGFEGCQSDLRHAGNLATGAILVDDVFHKENWSVELGKGEDEQFAFNYGVTQALWGFLQGIKGEARIIPVGKGGLALIKI